MTTRRCSTVTALALLAAASGLAVASIPSSAQPSNKPRNTTRTAPADRNATTDREDHPATTTTTAPDQHAAPPADFLYLYSAGLDEALSNPKDTGLRNALSLVEGRLIELAQSQGNMPEPEKLIHTIWTLWGSPMELRVAATEPGENGEPPIAFSIHSRPEDADALERTISSLLRSNDVTMRSTDHGREFDTPVGPARFSVSDGAFDLAFGPQLADITLSPNLPDGYTPLLLIHANLQNAQPLIEMALSQAPDADQARPMLENSGILGQDALIFDLAVGHNNTDSLLSATLHDARPRAAAMGIPQDVSLDHAFLSLIPADATHVTAGVFDLSTIDQVLDMPEVQDGLEQINAELGIDAVEDVLHQIGHRVVLYQSDTTGGGGVLSSVLILELNDPARFARAHRRIVDAANDLIAQQLQNAPSSGPFQPSVEIRPRRVDGVEFFTLTWPGLPIPAEISWVVHEDNLMLALSPRSLLEAIAQADDDGASFADSPALAHFGGADPGILSISFTDAPRFAVQGYSLVNLLCAGLSNALRTTDGPDPGIPLPAFNDFIRGVEPNIMVSRWNHNDLTIKGRGDASLLVNLAGSSGSIIGPMAIASAAGALLPALEQARASATEAKAMSQLRGVVMASVMYSAEHQDHIAPSLDHIREYLGDASLLSSPLGPCIDGSLDYAIRTDLGDTIMSQLHAPDQTLAAIDRASAINGAEKILVGFFDGHVEAIYSWQLTELLAQEPNHGAYEAFELPDWMNPGF